MIFDKVAEYAFIDSGQALIISRFGKIVHWRYQNDTSRETLINPQSMSKSLLALAIGYPPNWRWHKITWYSNFGIFTGPKQR